jgi:hypothetical protein
VTPRDCSAVLSLFLNMRGRVFSNTVACCACSFEVKKVSWTFAGGWLVPPQSYACCKALPSTVLRTGAVGKSDCLEGPGLGCGR